MSILYTKAEVDILLAAVAATPGPPGPPGPAGSGADMSLLNATAGSVGLWSAFAAAQPGNANVADNFFSWGLGAGYSTLVIDSPAEVLSIKRMTASNLTSTGCHLGSGSLTVMAYDGMPKPRIYLPNGTALPLTMSPKLVISASAGTFYIRINRNGVLYTSTAPIAWNASNATIQSAINAVIPVASASLVTTTFQIFFGQDGAGTLWSIASVDTTSLTGTVVVQDQTASGPNQLATNPWQSVISTTTGTVTFKNLIFDFNGAGQGYDCQGLRAGAGNVNNSSSVGRGIVQIDGCVFYGSKGSKNSPPSETSSLRIFQAAGGYLKNTLLDGKGVNALNVGFSGQSTNNTGTICTTTFVVENVTSINAGNSHGIGSNFYGNIKHLNCITGNNGTGSGSSTGHGYNCEDPLGAIRWTNCIDRASSGSAYRFNITNGSGASWSNLTVIRPGAEGAPYAYRFDGAAVTSAGQCVPLRVHSGGGASGASGLVLNTTTGAAALAAGAEVATEGGTYTTTNRPSAASMGAGASVFDLTLTKPVWSTGSVWKDATGATV